LVALLRFHWSAALARSGTGGKAQTGCGATA